MRNQLNITDDRVERIIEAIVVRAANDYRGLFRRRLYGRKLTEEEETEFDKTEEFFESKWFTALTNMDGSYIMRKLEQEEREKKREKLNIKNK